MHHSIIVPMWCPLLGIFPDLPISWLDIAARSQGQPLADAVSIFPLKNRSMRPKNQAPMSPMIPMIPDWPSSPPSKVNQGLIGLELCSPCPTTVRQTCWLNVIHTTINQQSDQSGMAKTQGSNHELPASRFAFISTPTSALLQKYLQQQEIQWKCSQWPLQESKLEVPTMYMASVRAM